MRKWVLYAEYCIGYWTLMKHNTLCMCFASFGTFLVRNIKLDFPYPWSRLFKLTQKIKRSWILCPVYCAFPNRVVHGITSYALLYCLVEVLKHNIQRDKITQAPITVILLASLAKLYEEKIHGHNQIHETSKLLVFLHILILFPT